MLPAPMIPNRTKSNDAAARGLITHLNSLKKLDSTVNGPSGQNKIIHQKKSQNERNLVKSI
jgi:chaperonin GroEL (HSP60 family)